MRIEIDPMETSRRSQFECFRNCACPTIVATKIYDVTPLLRYGRKHNMKFNMLLCWLMGKVASKIDVLYTIYEPYRLYKYDKICVNIVVPSSNDCVNLCDVPYNDSLEQFAADYDRITYQSIHEQRDILLDDYARLGTSAVIQTELASVTGGYNDKYTNPFLSWARYHKGWLKTTLPITLRANHIQMDGGHCARYLEMLQEEIKNITSHSPS